MAYRIFRPVPTVLAILHVGGVLAALVAVFVTPQPDEARATVVACFAGFALVWFRYFQRRYQIKRSIIHTTTSGVGIIPSDHWTVERWSHSYSIAATQVIEQALAWWVERFPDLETRLRAAWAGQLIRIYSTLIPYGDGQLSGMTDDTGEIQISWLADWPFDRVASLIRHELGHVARTIITAGTNDGASDHRYFSEAGYGA